MLRISQCKTGIEYTRQDLLEAACKKLNIGLSEVLELEIVKKSLDARKKPNLFFSMTLDVKVKREEMVLKRNKTNRDVMKITEKQYVFPYRFPQNSSAILSHRPIVIGAGPAGLVCAYYLAKYGFKPIVLERGKCVKDRMEDVESFWKTKVLNPESNVQFGEGGAGTFSDGKLNTLVKDKNGRCKAVLSLFVKMGADDSILYEQKPHVGTDRLAEIVKNLRKEIIRLGGDVHFEEKVTDFIISNDRLCQIVTSKGKTFDVHDVVLAIGHSARDTFQTLYERQIPMEAKSFAVGLRVQHPQQMIDESQYGCIKEQQRSLLGAASYKLTAQTGNERGVYTFCMCPGGYVVNASSEEGMLAVNGMSYHDRDSGVANSAVIVTVTKEDFPGNSPLSGIMFQRKLERKAFALANGAVPVQLFGDFKKQRKTDFDVLEKQEHIKIKGAFASANLSSLFPESIYQAFVEGMDQFGRKIKGFSDDATVLAGVESRTSSPVRIMRDESGQSVVRGLFPCGEGAGYAGGITSAAMDGIYIAECVAKDILEEYYESI